VVQLDKAVLKFLVRYFWLFKGSMGTKNKSETAGGLLKRLLILQFHLMFSCNIWFPNLVCFHCRFIRNFRYKIINISLFFLAGIVAFLHRLFSPFIIYICDYLWTNTIFVLYLKHSFIFKFIITRIILVINCQVCIVQNRSSL